MSSLRGEFMLSLQNSNAVVLVGSGHHVGVPVRRTNMVSPYKVLSI